MTVGIGNMPANLESFKTSLERKEVSLRGSTGDLWNSLKLRSGTKLDGYLSEHPDIKLSSRYY